MCDDFFDDGIGAEELGIFLGISDELQEEEEAKRINNDALTIEERLKPSNEILNGSD